MAFAFACRVCLRHPLLLARSALQSLQPCCATIDARPRHRSVAGTDMVHDPTERAPVDEVPPPRRSFMPVMDRLRAETRELHDRVEQLPFATALTAGQLPLASYVGLLQAL